MCNSYFQILKINPSWYFKILLMSFIFEKEDRKWVIGCDFYCYDENPIYRLLHIMLIPLYMKVSALDLKNVFPLMHLFKSY